MRNNTLNKHKTMHTTTPLQQPRQHENQPHNNVSDKAQRIKFRRQNGTWRAPTNYLARQNWTWRAPKLDLARANRTLGAPTGEMARANCEVGAPICYLARAKSV